MALMRGPYVVPLFGWDLGGCEVSRGHNGASGVTL
jgi:hypothetical protein